MLQRRIEQLSEAIIVATPVADNTSVPQAAKEPAKHKKEKDRETAAHRLRRAGWSYRRIAETLGVPYIMIGRWLSGDSEPSAPPPPAPEFEPAAQAPTRSASRGSAPVSAPAARAAAPSAADDDLGHRVDVLGSQFSAFERYVRELIDGFGKDRAKEASAQEKALARMKAEREAIEGTKQEILSAVEALRSDFEQFRSEVQGELETLRNRAPAQEGGKARRGASDEDPFGSGSSDSDDPFASGDEDDPFASKDDDPFATKDDEDPFASKDDEDPFASKDDDDPFASKDDDPFATKDDEDPFATTDDDPFGSSDDDPFADPKPSRK